MAGKREAAKREWEGKKTAMLFENQNGSHGLTRGRNKRLGRLPVSRRIARWRGRRSRGRRRGGHGRSGRQRGREPRRRRQRAPDGHLPVEPPAAAAVPDQRHRGQRVLQLRVDHLVTANGRRGHRRGDHGRDGGRRHGRGDRGVRRHGVARGRYVAPVAFLHVARTVEPVPILPVYHVRVLVVRPVKFSKKRERKKIFTDHSFQVHSDFEISKSGFTNNIS